MSHFYANLKHYNVCVLGETGVGKSALVLRFVQSHFVEDYDPTFQETYSSTVTLESETGKETTVALDILDTVGIEDYSDSRELQIREADAIVLCYDVTSRQSYDIVTILHQQVLRCHDEDNLPPVVLCGLQSDIVNERQLSYADGEMLAHELKVDFFLETSSKLKVNVEELFKRLTEAVLIYEEKHSKAVKDDLATNAAGVQEQQDKEQAQSKSFDESVPQQQFVESERSKTPLPIAANAAPSKPLNTPKSVPTAAQGQRGIQQPQATQKPQQETSRCCVIM